MKQLLAAMGAKHDPNDDLGDDSSSDEDEDEDGCETLGHVFDLNLLLCLSRACLGKMIVSTISLPL